MPSKGSELRSLTTPMAVFSHLSASKREEALLACLPRSAICGKSYLAD